MKIISAKKNKNIYVEILLNNIVDKDIQMMLIPLNFLQILFVCPKYLIRDNFIFPNNAFINYFSFCGTFVNVSLTLYCIYATSVIHCVKTLSSYFCITTLIDLGVTCIGFIVNCLVNFYITKNNTFFVLTIQEVHRILNDKRMFKFYMILNWISVFIVFTVSVGNVVLASNLFENPPFYLIWNLFNYTVFDHNMLYAMRLMHLLHDKATLWMEYTHRWRVTEENRKEGVKNIFNAYVKLLESYKLLTETFEILIVFQIIRSFIHVLVYNQVGIEWISVLPGKRQHTLKTSPTSLSIYRLVKMFILNSLLSFHCEKFYSAVKSAQELCTIILMSGCTEEEKKVFKNIQRLHRATFSKINACGLVYIDAALPLKLQTLLTNYTIVLLQFAFL